LPTCRCGPPLLLLQLQAAPGQTGLRDRAGLPITARSYLAGWRDARRQSRSAAPPRQVFSAICVIFSHGAGEIGYMTGPLGAIWQVGSCTPCRCWCPPLAAGRLEAFQLLSGPTSAAFAVQVYTSGKIVRNLDPPIWMIVICAGSLVVGLATYGYNVTRAMGVRLAKLSPVRGFAAELATAMVIMVAAQVGL
jgi:sodium-dependent phosphate transporter